MHLFLKRKLNPDLKIISIHTVFRMEVGTWKPGVPGVMSWQPGAMDMIQKFRPRDKLRVIVVEQPPFVEWNEDRRKIENDVVIIKTYLL